MMTRISIHAPREGSDKSVLEAVWYKKEFQSTLPVRGATWGCGIPLPPDGGHFNPRSP